MAKKKEPIKKALTTGKIAKYCNVNVKTVLKWIEEKKLNAYQLPGGSNRIPLDDFISFLKAHDMPIPLDVQKTDQKRVLIVDDSENIAKTLMRMLVMDDMQVDHAADGFEAGYKVDSFKPDLILLDLQMPRMDGYEVVKKMKSREETAHVKIIVVSGAVTDQMRTNLSDYGVNEIVEKPFAYEKLHTLIQELLR